MKINARDKHISDLILSKEDLWILNDKKYYVYPREDKYGPPFYWKILDKTNKKNDVFT